MAHLHYVTINGYRDYNSDRPPGPNNPGGGMPMKTLTVREAWERYYDVIVDEDIEACPDVDILVIEPLWFRLRGNYPHLNIPDLEESVTQYENHKASMKVLYTSELSFLKIPYDARVRIVEASNVVTTNCPFQCRIFEMLGINSFQLTDPVRESVHYSENEEKELSVFALGRISTTKNSQKVVEIYRALEGKGIKRVYVGDAGLWGNAEPVDKRIEREMRDITDEYHPNMKPERLAEIYSRMACGIFDTFHDSSSTSNMEASMGGVYSFFGMLETWRGRPGVQGLDTIDDFVNALSEATEGFTAIPNKQHFREAREWAMSNYSQARFLDDWKRIKQYVG